jgi:Kef-type K+ transport system membrane component KefB
LGHPSTQWLLCGLIILVATIGKFGGTLVAARLTGMDWRGAAGLGVLMNTRGLMELIVLNIGLDLRVISPALFTMMVLMALVTTVATTPALQLLGLDRARLLRYNTAAVLRSASQRQV